MKQITLIVKATMECNLRCKYCYNALEGYNKGVMSYDILDKLIYMTQDEYQQVRYIWHGGEPLLCGLDFYRACVKLQKKYCKEDSIIENYIQTNGTLLKDEFIDFFVSENFIIGISFDGPLTNGARQNTKEVMDTISELCSKKIKWGGAAVVSSINNDKQIEIYEYYKDLGIGTKLNPLFNAGGVMNNDELSLELNQYLASTKELIEHWIYDKKAIDVFPVINYIRMGAGLKAKECEYSSCLTHWLGVSPEGDLYPCGRDYPKEFCLGNVRKVAKISEAFLSASFKDIVIKSISRREKCKKTCELLELCQGGCGNNAIHENGLDQIDGFSCAVTRDLVSYCRKKLNSIKMNNEISNCNKFVQNLLS